MWVNLILMKLWVYEYVTVNMPWLGVTSVNKYTTHSLGQGFNLD